MRREIEWIQDKIQVSKRQQVVVASASSTADELSKLNELHKQGILSDTEFNDAKSKLISRL